MSIKNTNKNTESKVERRIDPKLTVKHYSIYQNWDDILMSLLMCAIVVFIAILVVTLLYLLVISPHPIFNIFYMVTKPSKMMIAGLVKAIKLFFFLLYN
jgi:hypothetical protein